MSPASLRRAGAVALALGAGLVACDVLGLFGLGRYESRPPRAWERFDPALAAATPDLATLFAAAGGDDLLALPPERRPAALFDAVVQRFTHGDATRHTVCGNWLAFAAGRVHAPAGRLHEPAGVLRLGHSAWCSEQSAVFAALAQRAALPARLVWLDGHVVAEVRYGGAWHAFDPDLEVVPRDAAGAVLPVAALAADPALVRAAYGHRGSAKVAQLAAIYDNAARHRYDERPAASGARRFERATERLKWVVPLGLIVAGAVVLARGRAGGVRDRRPSVEASGGAAAGALRSGAGG